MKKNLNRTSTTTSAVGIIFHLADGTIQSCNKNAETILGYTSEQMVGCSSFEPPWQTIHRDGSVFLPETYPATTSLRTGQSCSDVVMGFYRPSGDLIWLAIDTLPLFKANSSEPYGVEVTFIDITDEIKAQTTPRTSTKRLTPIQPTRSLTDFLPGVVYVYDAIAEQNIYINSQVVDLLGYEPQQISEMGADFLVRVMHPEDLARFSAYIETLNRANGREIANFEYRMRHQNGEWRWFSSEDRVYSRTEDGSVEQILGVAKDITQIKQTEVELTNTNSILQSVIEGSADAIFVKDRQGCYVTVNQSAANWLGLTVEEIVGRDDRTLFNSEIAEAILEVDRQVIADNKVISFEEKIDFPAKTRSLFTNKYPWRDDTGRILGVIGISKDITPLKESEQKLRANEQLLRLALSSAKAASWNWEIATEKIVWSPESYDLYGFEPKIESTYEIWKSILYPEDFEATERELERVLADPSAELRFEFRIVHPQKGIRWILGVGNVTRNQSGEPVSFSGINLDISEQQAALRERKQAEEKLRRNEQHLRRVIDSLLIYVGVLTPDGVLIEVNRTALEHANLRSEDVLNKPFAETYWWSFDPEIQAQLNEAIERAAAGERVRYDTVSRMSENNLIQNDFSIVPIFNDDGEVEYLIPSGIDISDREASKQALQQSEYELRLITEIIPQQIWTATPDGKIEYINQRWQEYTGVTLEQIQGDGWSTIIHPDDLERVRETWDRAIAFGKKYNIEARLRSADRKYNWFLGRARPLRNERGDIVKWYGTNTNINRIKELEETLRQQTEDLIQANQLKDEFLAIVSHELRTPLNPILGWSQLLTAGKLDAEKTAQGVEIIQRNAKLQAQLIDDLLDVARILRGKLALKLTPLNLESIIRSALATVQLTAEAKSIQINTEFEPNIGQVAGDAGRLQQVIWNLVSNAIKFTPESGQVKVSLKRIGKKAQILVTDTGQGIDREFLPYVFERFRQAESSSTRNFGGLGLGLAIVRHLTELHGGTVAVSSPGLGQGATFRIELPLINTSTIEQPEKEIALSVKPERFGGLQVLVVDDELDSLDILTLILQQEGAEVISVTSANEAIEAFNYSTPDLIISDIGMPQVDGYTLITQIRQLPQGKNVPAIALTAYAGEVNKQRSIDAGYQKHLAKPINIDELISVITVLLPSKLK